MLRIMEQRQLVNFANKVNVIVNADALLKGSYSGMVDTSKIPKKNFDWCRSIEK